MINETYIYNRLKEIDRLFEKWGFGTPLKNTNNSIKTIVNNSKPSKYKKTNFTARKFENEYGHLISKISESNGSRFYKKVSKPKVAIVTDDFMYNYYKNSLELYYVTKENYKEVFEQNDIEFLMFVSCWGGMNNEWKGVASGDSKKQDYFEIVDFAKAKNILSVFQTIEDPSNYESFLEIAKRSDYIFTTAIEKVEDYKRDCNKENVSLLKYGINPYLHNPVGMKEIRIEDSILFAGSWTEKYQERCDDIVTIFDSILEADKKLNILDRNHTRNLGPEYAFPAQYNSSTFEGVEHTLLQKIHRLYDYSINLNSIKYSKTMCAMRVYELQAIGNFIISNYSIAISNDFPNVFMSTEINKGDIKSLFERNSEKELYQMQMSGLRNMMTNCTSFVRVNEILSFIGKSQNENNLNNKILVIVDELTENIKKMLDNQTVGNENITVVTTLDEVNLGDYVAVTYFNNEYKYGEFYLEDMINAFKYVDVDFVTKYAYKDGLVYKEGVEHNFVSEVRDIYMTMFFTDTLTKEQLINKDFSSKSGYAIDRFEVEINQTEKIKVKKDFKLSVVVPVYNNGDFLYGRCFASLRRSTMFEDMEILLIDDGSTDNYTKKIINRLEHEYNNVVTYFFDDGGSGSASRPRNKGEELATAPHITYLDPDNEAICDGYYQLYQKAIEEEVDVVLGNYYKFTDKFNKVTNPNKNKLIEDPKTYLMNNYSARSNQAMVIKTSVLKENKIDSVVGAVGQDTLFYYELMCVAKSFKIFDIDMFIYYANMTGSTVNYISKKFFHKSLLLEKELVKRLTKHGIIENYAKNKLEHFYVNWYLEKIKLLNTKNESDVIESIDLLVEIYNCYLEIKDFKVTDVKMKEFIELATNKKYEEVKTKFIV